MIEYATRLPLIELTSADTQGPGFSMFKRGEDESGQVRFDNVPPGHYHIRLGQFFAGWAPGRVLSKVEVETGSTQEVTVHVPSELVFSTHPG